MPVFGLAQILSGNTDGFWARCKINVGVFKEKDTRDCQKVIK
jgi:hypothetical protein